MQKITPFLWFDNQAQEAVNFYTSIFKNSGMGRIVPAPEGTPGVQAGAVLTVSFRLCGLEFAALNGGPLFKFNPAMSFFVSCETEQETDDLWKRLSEGGMALMELGKYPFSDKFGWLQDKYGLSWQLSLTHTGQKITPFLMFVGQQGQAEEAINFYTSIFSDSDIVNISRYGAGEGAPEGSVKHATFKLAGQEFMAIDGGANHRFTFNEAVSLVINCENQEEVDEFWRKLIAGGAESQCGWLKDKFGVWWQVVPTVLNDMFGSNDKDAIENMMQELLKMRKLDINILREAYEGKLVR